MAITVTLLFSLLYYLIFKGELPNHCHFGKTAFGTHHLICTLVILFLKFCLITITARVVY